VEGLEGKGRDSDAAVQDSETETTASALEELHNHSSLAGIAQLCVCTHITNVFMPIKRKFKLGD